MKIIVKKSAAPLPPNAGGILDTLNITDKIKNTYSAHIIDALLSEVGISETIIQTIINTAKLEAHPIGSYYYSEDSTDPSELFGGTWERIKDKFLYALGDEGNAGDEGGASSITLTKANLPNYNLTVSDPGHTHSYTDYYATSSSANDFNRTFNNSGITSVGNTSTSRTSGSRTTGITVSSGGSGTAFSIIPTHIKAYCWKRVS